MLYKELLGAEEMAQFPCRGPRFNSQNPWGKLMPSAPPVPGDVMPVSCLFSSCMLVLHINSCTHTHTQINLKSLLRIIKQHCQFISYKCLYSAIYRHRAKLVTSLHPCKRKKIWMHSKRISSFFSSSFTLWDSVREQQSLPIKDKWVIQGKKWLMNGLS